MKRRPRELHGVLAEFPSMERLIDAVKKTRAAGYRKIDCFTPYPDHALIAAMDLPRSKVPLLVLLGGIVGCVGGFGLQYWTAVVDYPLNIGGRPPFSWPSFIPVTFECTVLAAGLAAVFGMLALCGFPSPYHATFSVERFVLASRDRYFLGVDASDPLFQKGGTAAFLAGLDATEVNEVES